MPGANIAYAGGKTPVTNQPWGDSNTDTALSTHQRFIQGFKAGYFALQDALYKAKDTAMKLGEGVRSQAYQQGQQASAYAQRKGEEAYQMMLQAMENVRASRYSQRPSDDPYLTAYADGQAQAFKEKMYAKYRRKIYDRGKQAAGNLLNKIGQKVERVRTNQRTSAQDEGLDLEGLLLSPA